FRPRIRGDDDSGKTRKRRAPVRRHANRAGAATPRVTQGRENVRRGAAGGKSHDDVALVYAQGCKIALSPGGGILGAFDSLRQRPASARNNRAHKPRRDAKSRGTFGGVEHGE